MGEREVPVTSVEQLRDGARVRCKIEGVQIDDARLSCDQGDWYVCQNTKNGSECADRKGYHFSWWFSLENSLFLTDLFMIEDDATASPSAPEAVTPRKRRLYLANKMRGLPFFNFPWFDAMRDSFTALGWDVVSPADLDRAHGFDAMKLPADYDWNTIPAECGTEEEIMKRDIEALKTCDAIWLGPQWRDSKGACLESKAALEAGLVVFSAPDWLGDLPTPDAIDDHDEHMKRMAAMKASSEVGAGQVQELAPAGHAEVRITDSLTGGQKGAKPERYDLIPVEPLAELARHYGVGARKYADHNYRKGYKWSLSYAALQRHLNAFWRGEDMDAETGSKHVIAAAFHCLALAEYMDTRRSHDDRYVREAHVTEAAQ